LNAGFQQIVWIQANEDAVSAAVTQEPYAELHDISQELGLSHPRICEILHDLRIYVA
jgi:hypothetical protein